MTRIPNTFADQVAALARELADERVAAMAGLFDLTAVRLVRYAIAITRQQEDAEDAVQAALLHIAANPSLFSTADQPWPYLLRMVRNEALQTLRRRRRRSLLACIIDPTWRQTVENQEQQETKQAVWTALRRLPPEQAEVVVLKIWESLTFAEIGDVLGKSPHTVASRYQYAMRRLERQLQPWVRESLR